MHDILHKHAVYFTILNNLCNEKQKPKGRYIGTPCPMQRLLKLLQQHASAVGLKADLNNKSEPK